MHHTDVTPDELVSDEELIRRAGGSGEPYAELYRRHSEPVYRWLRGACRDPLVAEELTADTFAEALAGAPRFDARRGPFRAWLFGIAHHRWQRWLRERAAARPGCGDEPVTGDEADRVLERVEAAANAARLAAAIDRLSPLLREAVLLRVVEQHDYAELGVSLGVPSGVVRVRVHRGLAQLGTALAAAGVDAGT